MNGHRHAPKGARHRTRLTDRPHRSFFCSPASRTRWLRGRSIPIPPHLVGKAGFAPSERCLAFPNRLIHPRFAVLHHSAGEDMAICSLYVRIYAVFLDQVGVFRDKLGGLSLYRMSRAVIKILRRRGRPENRHRELRQRQDHGWQARQTSRTDRQERLTSEGRGADVVAKGPVRPVALRRAR